MVNLRRDLNQLTYNKLKVGPCGPAFFMDFIAGRLWCEEEVVFVAGYFFAGVDVCSAYGVDVVVADESVLIEVCASAA